MRQAGWWAALVLLLAGCAGNEFTAPATPAAMPATPLQASLVALAPTITATIPTETPSFVAPVVPTPTALSRALANAVEPLPGQPAMATLAGGQVQMTLVASPTPSQPAAPTTTLPALPTNPPQIVLVTWFPTLTPSPAAVANLPTIDLMLPPGVLDAAGNLPIGEAMLRSVPVLAQFDTPQVRMIVERGRAMGNQRQMFTTLGDSNSISGDFLRPLVIENYCQWGAYAPLEAAVRFFSVPTGYGAAASSFTHESVAVQMGFNSAAALDPFWAGDARCVTGEAPLSCELRTLQPAAAIFMVGSKDVSIMSVAEYQQHMATLVDLAISRGVVPVLTTFVVLPGRDVYPASIDFNLALVDLAQRRGTPLINLWAAAEALPNRGIAADNTHLSTQPGRFCNFEGGQSRFGGTLRNLLTLQALDRLRLGALAG